MYRVKIYNKENHYISIVNKVHHITYNSSLNFIYLWKGEKEISENYIGIIDATTCNVVIEKE